MTVPEALKKRADAPPAPASNAPTHGRTTSICTKITKSSIFVQIFLHPRRAPSARTPARRTTGGLGCPLRCVPAPGDADEGRDAVDQLAVAPDQEDEVTGQRVSLGLEQEVGDDRGVAQVGR